MKVIESKNNGLITEIAKLKDKKHRDKTGLFFFEGKKLAKEAIDNGIKIKYIFLTEKFESSDKFFSKFDESILISEEVLTKLTENNAPEGIVCVAEKSRINVKYSLPDTLSSTPVILSEIRDPGNLGTIIRTAGAFGKKTVILSSDCADLFNQKVIRASMGGVFRLEFIISDNLTKTIEKLKNTGLKIYATALHKDSVMLNKLTEKEKNPCFVLGNEGHGLSDEITEVCNGTVLIPMESGAESLNVSSAATVLLWETYRRN